MRRKKSKAVQVIDLFSGPGGLGEGFSTCRDAMGQRAFNIEVSIEKDAAAHQTLRLRAFLRRFPIYPPEYYEWLAGKTAAPDWSAIYPVEWRAAEREAVCAELGQPETAKLLSERIAGIRARAGGRTLLIGGPPCQAYSLAGRSRNAGRLDYRPQDDARNFLYREYCRVLDELRPAVFVMENVKGMLSSTVEGLAIFERVLGDLAGAGDGYRLFGLSGSAAETDLPDPRRFLLRAEDYGVPQARHRVIIVGIRSDVASKLPPRSIPTLLKRKAQVQLRHVLKGMPPLRSGLSGDDSPDAWADTMRDAIRCVRRAARKYPGDRKDRFIEAIREAEHKLPMISRSGRHSKKRGAISKSLPTDLAEFIDDPNLTGLSCHETRGHMPSDLARYLYAACFALAEELSPRAHEFPEMLAPDHRNWKSGKFNDRFRVQVRGGPSSTVTSHISKDGHYFIHPDPTQCRSLTVREAARLQTFPDNYHFLGNRTEQFVQVGNAVPPFLAKQIAEALLPVFGAI